MSAVGWVPDEVAQAVDLLIDARGYDDAEQWLQTRKQAAASDSDDHETVLAALAELRKRQTESETENESDHETEVHSR